MEKPEILKNKNVGTIFRGKKCGEKSKTGHIKCI